MKNSTLMKTVNVLTEMSIADLNARRPIVAGHAALSWNVDAVLFVKKCIMLHLNIVRRVDRSASSKSERRLTILQNANTGLDKANLSRILHLPEVVEKIPEEYRAAIGVPLAVCKHGPPVSRLLHNAKEFANMSAAQLDSIKHSDCGCHRIPDGSGCKVNGHLLTRNPAVFPTPNLVALAEMGGQYRPAAQSNMLDSDSKRAALEEVCLCVLKTEMVSYRVPFTVAAAVPNRSAVSLYVLPFARKCIVIASLFAGGSVSLICIFIFSISHCTAKQVSVSLEYKNV